MGKWEGMGKSGGMRNVEVMRGVSGAGRRRRMGGILVNSSEESSVTCVDCPLNPITE